MRGIKHLVQCHCILPQYRDRKDPIFHQFVVFSVVDDSDTVVPKYVQCNNCAIVHKVVDICRTELAVGKDELSTMMTVDDVAITIPQDIRSVLESYKADIATWENVQFILQQKCWGNHVVLTHDVVKEDVQGKLLMFNGPGLFNIETFIRKDVISMEV
jgi:hypothetical protein